MEYKKFKSELARTLKDSVKNIEYVKDKYKIIQLLEIAAEEYLQKVKYVEHKGLRAYKDSLFDDVKECIRDVSNLKIESLDKTREYLGRTIEHSKWFASGSLSILTDIKIEFYRLSSGRVLMIPVCGHDLHPISIISAVIIPGNEYDRIKSAETNILEVKLAFEYFYEFY